MDVEPMIRSMMKMSLAEMGYSVTGAYSVEEALGIYENDSCRFSTLVTDFNLEDGTGMDIVNTVFSISHAQVLANAVPDFKFTSIEGGHNNWGYGDRVAFRYP